MTLFRVALMDEVLHQLTNTPDKGYVAIPVPHRAPRFNVGNRTWWCRISDCQFFSFRTRVGPMSKREHEGKRRQDKVAQDFVNQLDLDILD